MLQKWVCNKCGFETTDKPSHSNSTCTSCKSGRFRCLNLCECGKWFHPDRMSQQYCSKDCGYKYKKSGGKKGKHYPHNQRARIAVCPVCGQEFRAVKDYKGKKAVYCSKECWSRRASHEKVCPICGEKFKSSYSQNKKYCSLECRNKAYKDRTGELSNFWEGGKTAKKKLLRTCADYKAWRLAVFKRDNFICQKCGKHSTNLEAHHLKEVCNYPEQIFDIDNGVTLCHQCHKETDNYGNKARELKITKEGENYGQ